MKIRKFQPNDLPTIASVHVHSWRSTYAGIVPDSFLNQLNTADSEQRYQRILANSKRQAFFYVAETPDNHIVGYALGGLLRQGDPSYQGELYAIYLLEEAQHQGIGRSLFQAVVEQFRTQGLTSFLVWVLAENKSARGFYEALGGQFVESNTLEIGGKVLEDIAYGWSDIPDMSF